ncbi:hypothetical protein ABPG77_001405 [Micractinium sp. CCAP 211/92]
MLRPHLEKSTPSARQQQFCRQLGRPLRRTAALRPFVRAAAFLQPSSPGSQPAGSGSSPPVDVLESLQGIYATLQTMQAAQATQAQTLDELKTRLQSVEGDIEAVQDDMSRLEDAIEAVQATQTSWAQTLGALAEDSVLVRRYLTKEKQLRRGVLVSKGRGSLTGRRAAHEPPASAPSRKAVAAAGKRGRTLGDNAAKGP